MKTPPPPLTPAQKVRKAAVDAYWLFHPDQAAALLIAAADQVVPEEIEPDNAFEEEGYVPGRLREQRQSIRRRFLSLANELDPTP